MNLVTGGAGFFGHYIVKMLLEAGEPVTVFDLNAPTWSHPNMRSIRGDIRDYAAVSEATRGAKAVFHNVAQVPLAKDRDLFWSVNRDGTANALEAALHAKVGIFVYTSSSAIYGIPSANPVTEETAPSPAEDYGRAKLAGEVLCDKYQGLGLNTAVIRPRTILGGGRLGIFQILFEWIYRGLNVPVLGSGDNVYQFVHAEDVASACILAARNGARGHFNIGADGYGTMRQSLETLISYAGSRSRVRSVPRATALVMRAAGALGLTPLALYHALLYGESLYFDSGKAKRELSFTPKFSQDLTLSDAYSWYVTNRDNIISGEISGSEHQSRLKQGVLSVVPYLI